MGGGVGGGGGWGWGYYPTLLPAQCTHSLWDNVLTGRDPLAAGVMLSLLTNQRLAGSARTPPSPPEERLRRLGIIRKKIFGGNNNTNVIIHDYY